MRRLFWAHSFGKTSEAGGLSVRPAVAVAFACLSLALVASNVLLITRSRALAAELKTLKRVLELSPGVQLRPIVGSRSDGRPESLFYGSREDTLLLVFSPDCSPCNANWHNWEAIIRATAGRVRVAFVDAPGLRLSRQYVQSHGLEGGLVFARVDAQTALDYRLHVTPQTVLVGPAGRVLLVRSGGLSTEAVRDVEGLVGTGVGPGVAPAR